MFYEKRLIEIYNQSSNFFYNNKKNFSEKSKHWSSYYDSQDFNLYNLKNFRNSKNNLSRGLDSTGKNFTFKLYSEIINKVSENYLLNNLPKENIGNSDYLIPYKNCFLDTNKLIHIYWFWIIENEILKEKKISNICDIGGGFGSFSELFIRNYNTKTFLIDLPEANLISTFYLKKLFPNKKFYLFNDYIKNKFLSKFDFENNDIIILPPNCNIDKEIKIDFFINTRSMMEMNYEVIKSYFNLIQKHSIDGGYFLNINRYEKNTVGYPIRIAEYPYDDCWNVIISEASFNQKKIHFLLTQRTFENDKKNIIEELNNIKKISKKFYRSRKISNRILKMFFGVKFLKLIANFLLKISDKLKSVE
jgi:hypothetical protein